MGGVTANSQRPSPAGRASPFPITVQFPGVVTAALTRAFRSGWSKAAKTRWALSSPPCRAR